MALAISTDVPNEVSTITRVFGSASTICRVASAPFIFGIIRSMMTTSGFALSAMATALSPSQHSPMTVKSPVDSSMDRMPTRMSAWSSAMRILGFACFIAEWKCGRTFPCALILC